MKITPQTDECEASTHPDTINLGAASLAAALPPASLAAALPPPGSAPDPALAAALPPPGPAPLKL